MLVNNKVAVALHASTVRSTLGPYLFFILERDTLHKFIQRLLDHHGHRHGNLLHHGLIDITGSLFDHHGNLFLLVVVVALLA